jgi:transcriptional regulator with XRE-family HTH domain
VEIYPPNSDSSVFYAGLFMRDSRLVAFGARVRSIRKDKGLSQEGLSNLAGIDRSYMGQIERGEINLTLTKMYQIADALNVELSQLL